MNIPAVNIFIFACIYTQTLSSILNISANAQIIQKIIKENSKNNTNLLEMFI